MKTQYVLQDDKKSVIRESKGSGSVEENPFTERHSLNLNSRTFYYSGSVGLEALRQDAKQLKQVGFIID